MPHWILAVRSRKRNGSLASALITGIAKNTYTGMNTVNALSRPVPTSTYCIGRMTKKASSRARWSARRVWVRVTNSRSAKKETKPNSSVEPSGPDAHDTQNTSAASQSARSSRAKRSRSPACSGGRSRRVRPKATIVTSASRPNRTTNSRPTCWLTLSERSAPIRPSSEARPSDDVPQRHDGGAGAIEKGAPLFARAERDRRAADDGAQDRHRHDFALGHDALDVVDPGRDQLDVGERFCEREQARLERGRVGGVAARSLREDDQRVAVAERFHQRLERVFLFAAAVLRALAADVHRVEDLARDPVLERRRGPVVARGDRPRHRAQVMRQRGPDQHPVEVALVVGEIDPPLGLRRRSVPVALRAGDEAGDERQREPGGFGELHRR